MTTDISGQSQIVIDKQVTATIATAGANAIGTVTTAVTGARVGDIVTVASTTALVTHQSFIWAVVTADDTVSLYAQADATGYTQASKVYNLHIERRSL